jgi:hypothetical protein
VRVIDVLRCHLEVLELLTGEVRHLVPAEKGDAINSAIDGFRSCIDEYVPDELMVVWSQ